MPCREYVSRFIKKQKTDQWHNQELTAESYDGSHRPADRCLEHRPIQGTSKIDVDGRHKHSHTVREDMVNNSRSAYNLHI
jgi:hypothetical protein